MILSDWNNYNMEIPESVRKELERVTFELEPFFFGATVNIYINTPFFMHLCHREARAIESGFASSPQELRAIAFHHAVLINRADILKTILRASRKLKANINADFLTDLWKAPPLMTACYHGCRQSFLTLVKDGKADLSVRDDEGNSLARACIFANLSFMKWAQRHGVVFDARDPVEALIPLAAEHNFFPALRWLIEDLGGNVNIIDEYDCSALGYACLREEMEIFLYLVDKGAKLTGKYEILFDFILDQIRELQKQPPSKMIEGRIFNQMETLHFLMNKA